MIKVLVYSEEYNESEKATISSGNISNIASINYHLERLKAEGVSLIHSVTTHPFIGHPKGTLMMMVTIVYDNNYGEGMVCGPYVKKLK